MVLDIDQVFSTNIAFSYNLPHWQIGMEYMPTTAWYGDTDKAFGRPYIDMDEVSLCQTAYFIQILLNILIGQFVVYEVTGEIFIV